MLKKGFLGLIFALIFMACSKENVENESFVRAKTQGTITQNESIFVEFKEDFLKDKDLTNLSFKLNDKIVNFMVGVENDTLFLYPKLEAQKDYKLEFRIDKELVTLNFKTSYANLRAVNANFEELGKDKVRFNIELSKGVFYDEAFLKNHLKLSLDNENLSFSLKDTLGRFYLLQSEEFEKGVKPKEVRLALSEGLEKPLELKFQSPVKLQNEDFVFLGAFSRDNMLSLRFSQDLDERQNFKDFVSITPTIDAKIYSVGKELKISANFKPNETYALTLMQGLKSKQGLVNSGERVEFSFKDLEPSLSFASEGVFLESGANKTIYLKSRNVKEVQVEVYQVFTNNISQYLRFKELLGYKTDSSRDVYNAGGGFGYVSKSVLKEKLAVESQKNAWVQTKINLAKLKDFSGIFVINVKPLKYDYEFEEKEQRYKIENRLDIAKNIIFSNIALNAQLLNESLVIHARDFSQNKALKNVKIELIDKRNQTIKTALTNENGDASFENIKREELLYILAYDSTQMSVLKLSNPLSTDGYDVAGLQEKDAIKAFIYTERGVYRPGDTIHLSLVARNDKGSITHPVNLSFYNPKGQKILEKTLHSANDMFYEKLKLEKTAPSGMYRAEFNIAGREFFKDILVQNVVPNRIKVEIMADENVSEDINYTVTSHYLFGAKASNLAYENKLYFTPKPYENAKYPSFSFRNFSLLNLKDELRTKGVLDSEGMISERVKIPSKILNSKGQNFRINLISEVFEGGGRGVKSVKELSYNKYDYFVGLKNLENNHILEGAKVEFEAIVGDLTQNLVEGKKLHYKIYKNSHSWWWDYDDYEEFLRSIKQDSHTELIESGSVVSKNEPVKFSFDTKGHFGEMIIELSDEESGVSAMQSFYVGSFGEPSKADVLNSLKIKSDKQDYKIGEKARVEFESVAGAKALITLSDNAKILKRFIIDTKDKSTSVEFEMKESYAPNVYMSVSLFQDYHLTENDRALRLFGVLPLRVQNPKAHLELELKAPETLLPNEEFEVQIQSKNKESFFYTLALVDEGLLDISAFKTPDIYGYFYAKTGLKLLSFDTYSQIISKATGGDALSSGGANFKVKDENAERFKPVVLFNAPAKSDDLGFARLKFKMPNYVGSLRLMLIAHKQNSYASVEKNIKVSAPLVMLETLPRSLKTNDEFSLLTQIFKTKDTIKEAVLSVKSAKGLVEFEQESLRIDLANKNEQMLEFKAKTNGTGVERLEFELKAKDFISHNSVEIDIKPHNPYTYESESFVLKAGEKREFRLSDAYLKGTAKGVLKLSSKPILELDKRVKYLLSYPYGCVEQTISSALPQLFLDKFGVEFDEQKAVNHINKAIEKLASFQTSDGGFAYWSGGKTSSAWGSYYAGLFLLLAKEQGYYVPSGMLKKWLKFTQNFVQDTKNNADIKANMLYLLALAKEPNITAMNLLYENLENLSNEAKWQLAAAYKISGLEDIAGKIASASATKPNATNYHLTYGSTLREEAIIANAYKQIYGVKNENLVKNLSEALSSNQYLSTQTSAYALFALAKSFNLDENLSPMNARLELNDEKIELNQNKMQIFSFKEGKAIIEAKEDMFGIFGVEGVKKELNSEPFSQNLTIKREFYDENGNLINESLLKAPQSFWMKISVFGHKSVENLALTQILPSGWEVAENILDKNTPSFVKNSPLNFIDIRDDKIMWFFHQEDAQMDFFIKLNAVNAGTFSLSGAYVEAMYDEAFRALGESKKVIVTR